MKTYVDIQHEFSMLLQDRYPLEECEALFFMCYSHLTGKSRMDWLLTKNNPIAEQLQQQFQHLQSQLASGIPIQHLLEEADFFGLKFYVNGNVLIPRPETEELVDLILKDYPQMDQLQIIDIGTGSGCIPISLKKHRPLAEITALDISKDALAVAKRNAEKLATPIAFMEADILEWNLIFQEQQYAIIVSNPPYITPAEKESMEAHVLQHEPHLALFIEEEAPLLFYDYIADFALQHLTPDGSLYFEINQYLGAETKSLLLKKGFNDVTLLQDINGADRMIRAKR